MFQKNRWSWDLMLLFFFLFQVRIRCGKITNYEIWYVLSLSLLFLSLPYHEWFRLSLISLLLYCHPPHHNVILAIIITNRILNIFLGINVRIVSFVGHFNIFQYFPLYFTIMRSVVDVAGLLRHRRIVVQQVSCTPLGHGKEGNSGVKQDHHFLKILLADEGK